MKLRQPAKLVLAALTAFVLLATACGGDDDTSEPDASERETTTTQAPTTEAAQLDSSTTTVQTREGIIAMVDNRVTDGMGMREDDEQAYLSTEPQICRNNVVAHCKLPDTEMGSGTTLTLICQVPDGEWLTNGEIERDVDDDNLDLFESTLWYKAEHPNSSRGFISEVWIDEEFRGGMGLSICT